MIYATDKTQAKFLDQFDAYGDSYTAPVTENELRSVLDKMDISVSTSIITQALLR